MEFTPAHAHPFSVEEAAALDVNTIAREIQRLRTSLDFLATSQKELLAFLAEEEDADLRAAWKENEEVIASQTERIALLRHVLVSKVGEDSLAHYGIDAPTPAALLVAHERMQAEAEAEAQAGTGTGAATIRGGGQVQTHTQAQTQTQVPAQAGDDLEEDGGLHL